MTDIQDHYTGALAVETADDSMELASDYGATIGDEIDIDIDVAPQEDDQQMAEIVPTDSKSEELIDDFMVDDDQSSYQMDDVDHAQQEEVHDLRFNDADTLEDAPQLLETTIIEHPNDIDSAEAQTADMTSNVWDEPSVVDTEEISSKDEVKDMSPSINLGIEVAASVAYEQEQSTIADGAAKETGTETESTTAAEAVANTGDSVVSSPDREESKGENNDQGIIDQSTDNSGPHTITNATSMDVLVRYQSTEYVLIAPAGSEDPDSYFFKDNSLMTEPLGIFLMGLREVLRDDLAPDDELCMVVDDLGLEISESSATICETSFADLIDLVVELFRNDGVNVLSSLHVTLETKPDFVRRVASLMRGAADGKGLSELVAWEEQTASLYNDEEETDLNVRNDSGDFEAHDTQAYLSDNVNSGTGNNEKVAAPTEIKEITPGLDADEVQSDVQEQDREAGLHDTDADLKPNGNEIGSDLEVSVDNTYEALKEAAEEEDLLDYSDDDNEGDSHVFDTAKLEHPNEDFGAVDENAEVLPVDGEAYGDGSKHTDTNATVDTAIDIHKLKGVVEDEVQHDGSAASQQDQLSNEATADGQDQDEQPQNGDIATTDSVSIHSNERSSTDNEQYEGHDSQIDATEVNSRPMDPTGERDEQEAPGFSDEAGDEIGYEDEGPEDESNESSDPTIVGDEVAEYQPAQDTYDEIDYEEDDQERSENFDSHAIPTEGSPASNGKRSHTELGEDEEENVAQQDPKRVRS